MHGFMCIIDVFPSFRLSLCVVITWIVDVFPFLLVVVPCCIGKKRCVVFDIIIFFITIIFKWASSQNPFNTSFFYNVWFFVGSPYLFLCVVLAMFLPLLLLVTCGSIHTNVFPLLFIIIACYMWLSHEIINVLIFELNKLTPHLTLSFVTMRDYLFPTIVFLVVLSWLQFSLLSLFVALLHKEEKEDPMYKFIFSSIFSLIFKWTSSTKPHPLMCFFFGNVIFYS